MKTKFILTGTFLLIGILLSSTFNALQAQLTGGLEGRREIPKHNCEKKKEKKVKEKKKKEASIVMISPPTSTKKEENMSV